MCCCFSCLFKLEEEWDCIKLFFCLRECCPERPKAEALDAYTVLDSGSQCAGFPAKVLFLPIIQEAFQLHAGKWRVQIKPGLRKILHPLILVPSHFSVFNITAPSVCQSPVVSPRSMRHIQAGQERSKLFLTQKANGEKIITFHISLRHHKKAAEGI